MEILLSAAVPRRREGGVAGVVHNFGRELEELGHRVTYLFREDLLTASESAGRFGELRFSARVARHIRENRGKYSIVNLHGSVGAVYGVRRLVSAAGRGPAYILTLHGLEERRIHAMSREQKKGRAWHFSFKNRLWLRVYHRSLFFTAVMTADRVHCFSRDVWTILQLKHNLDPGQVAYIPGGVEGRFLIQREYADRKPVRLLYAGTWLDQRGIFYLRDALNGLNRKFVDWTLTIAGPGTPVNKVKEFFGETLEEQILVLPVVPADRMPELYSQHDIFVFPSLMEGQPLVVSEAMAGGMPVITTETCGMVDLVEDGLNGLLVPPADAIALEEAIFRLCQSVDLRRQLGRAAQQKMQRYTWKDAACRLERVFVSALQNDSSPLSLTRHAP